MTKRSLLIALFSLMTLFSVHGMASATESEPAGDPANTTCWKGKINADGTGGNKQCEVKEIPGEPTGTAKFSHTVTSQGGTTTAVDDGTITYSTTTGDTTNSSGQVTDHMQFSADGETMTHTRTEYNRDGSVKSTTSQAYEKVPCKKLKKPAVPIEE